MFSSGMSGVLKRMPALGQSNRDLRLNCVASDSQSSDFSGSHSKRVFFLLRPRISLKFVSILCLSESFHNQRKRLSGPVGVIPLPP